MRLRRIPWYARVRWARVGCALLLVGSVLLISRVSALQTKAHAHDALELRAQALRTQAERALGRAASLEERLDRAWIVELYDVGDLLEPEPGRHVHESSCWCAGDQQRLYWAELEERVRDLAGGDWSGDASCDTHRGDLIVFQDGRTQKAVVHALEALRQEQSRGSLVPHD